MSPRDARRTAMPPDAPTDAASVSDRDLFTRAIGEAAMATQAAGAAAQHAGAAMAALTALLDRAPSPAAARPAPTRSAESEPSAESYSFGGRPA